MDMASSSTNKSKDTQPSSSRKQQQGHDEPYPPEIVDHAKLLSDREELEKEVAALDAECREYHSKRNASAGLLQKLTGRSPKSKKEDTERAGKLDQMQDILIYKANASYEKTKELYANDYDKVARTISQRVRYEKYGIVLHVTPEPWENIYKMLPALHDVDLDRRMIILEHIWIQIPSYAKSVRKDAERVQQETSPSKATVAADKPGEHAPEPSPLVRRFIQLSDKLVDYRHLAKQIDEKSRKDLVPREELTQVKYDYMKILSVLKETGVAPEHRLNKDVFEEMKKSECSIM